MAITQQEQEILDKIKDIEVEQREARILVAFHKKAAVHAESRLIAANLTAEALKEELRVYLVKYPHYEESHNEKDIREFRDRLPELMAKLFPPPEPDPYHHPDYEDVCNQDNPKDMCRFGTAGCTQLHYPK